MKDWSRLPDAGYGRCVCSAPMMRCDTDWGVLTICIKSGWTEVNCGAVDRSRGPMWDDAEDADFANREIQSAIRSARAAYAQHRTSLLGNAAAHDFLRG